MRALVLAVVGAQYVHTALEHAMEVSAVCETLGAGMGAGEGASICGMGNAALRPWVGERFLELFKRTGKEKGLQKQQEFNALYRSAVDAVRTVTDVSQCLEGTLLALHMDDALLSYQRIVLGMLASH